MWLHKLRQVVSNDMRFTHTQRHFKISLREVLHIEYHLVVWLGMEADFNLSDNFQSLHGFCREITRAWMRLFILWRQARHGESLVSVQISPWTYWKGEFLFDTSPSLTVVILWLHDNISD